MVETGEPATDERLKYKVTVMARGIIFAADADDALHQKQLANDIGNGDVESSNLSDSTSFLFNINLDRYRCT